MVEEETKRERSFHLDPRLQSCRWRRSVVVTAAGVLGRLCVSFQRLPIRLG